MAYIPNGSPYHQRDRGAENGQQVPESVVTRINVDLPKIQAVLQEIHESCQSFGIRESKFEDDDILFGRLISVLCADFTLWPDQCAQILNAKYEYNLDQERIRRILHSWGLTNFSNRRALFQWAETIAVSYAGALMGHKEQFCKLEADVKTCTIAETTRYRMKERVAAIMIYVKYPEMDQYDDLNTLMRMRNPLAKHYFYHMYNALCHAYDYPILSTPRRKPRPERQMTYTQATRKIDELEAELERTNAMLGELQEEFDKQLQESKITELTDFFARLNSDRYGNILDQLLQVRRGMDQLKKEGYELPIEVNGLFIMVKQLIQFTRDSHIDPIMKLHARKEVTAADIEFCDYEGTPFLTSEEKKTIEAISPGWVYKDQNVQISRPKVKEIIKDAAELPGESPVAPLE